MELAGELLVRRVVLGDDHQARRAAVEPMDDARPLLAADAAQVVDMVEQGVDERAARVARGRVHDHAGRLVHDDQVVVLVDDRQRERFGLRRRVDRLRHVDADLLPGLERAVGLGRASVDLDVAVLDEALDLRTRLLRPDRDEKAIEPRRLRCRAGRVKVTPPFGWRACGSGSVRRAPGRSASTTASGTSSIEMNCDVEKIPTMPRGSSR